VSSVLRAVTLAEWRRWRRSWLRIAVLVLYIGAGAYAIHAGHRDVRRWEAAIANGTQREVRMQDEVRAFYAAAKKGPADRPWVDLSVGLWAEWYTGTYMGMRAQPLALVARGVSDVRGHVVRVNRFTSAFEVGEQVDLGNPEQQVIGALDLVFVLTMLMPLVALTFGFDILSYEREQGIATLVHVQSASLTGWFLARLFVVAVTILLPTLGLWLVGAGVGDAFAQQASAVWQGAGFLTLLVLVWVSLIGMVGAWVRTSATSALTLASLWVAVTLVAPALTNQIVNTRVPVGYASEITNAVQTGQTALFKRTTRELLPAVYEAFPQLRSAPYARFDDAPDSLRKADKDFFPREFAEHMLSRRAMEGVWSREFARERIAEFAQWTSPTMSAHLALTRLAGVDAQSHRAFEQAVVPVVRQKLASLLDGEWNNRKYDLAAYEALAAMVPADARYGGDMATTCWFVLLLWLSTSFVMIIVGLRHSPDTFVRTLRSALNPRTTKVA